MMERQQLPRNRLARSCTWVFCLALTLALPVFAATSSFEISLTAAQGRQVPVLVTHPKDPAQAKALIVFSHGAFAAPERYKRLMQAWAEGGYVVAAPMHVDSELNPDRDNFDRAQTMLTRLEDFGLLSTGEALAEALSAADIAVADTLIAAGHSYGAWIAQIAGGARLPTVIAFPGSMLAAQQSVAAVVALSPPAPMAGAMEKEDWSHISRPMLVVTGTADILPGFIDDWKGHLVSYEAAETAPSYALIFAEQDHYFNGAFGRPRESLQPGDIRALDSLNTKTLQFLDALLDKRLPNRWEWEGMSTDFVEARASALTEGHAVDEEGN
ncbi:MAG: dienelactone hydrolase [Halieaceae bacterium]|jgi:dienelactone hydrolase